MDVVPDLERPGRTGEMQTDCSQLVPRLSTHRYVKFSTSAKSGIDQLIPDKIFPSRIQKILTVIYSVFVRKGQGYLG